MARFKFKTKPLPGLHKTPTPPAPEGYRWTGWYNALKINSEQFRKTVCCNAKTETKFEGKLMVAICSQCQQKTVEYNGMNVRWLEKS